MQSACFSEEGLRDPSLPTTMPEPFRGIARECLHFDPKRRCSIAEIMARLQPAGRSVPAEPAPVPAPPVSARPYRHTWRILIPVAVLLVLAWGVRLVLKSSPPEASGPDQKTEVSAAARSAEAPNPTPAPAPRSTTNSKGEVLKQVIPDIPQKAKNTISGVIKIAARVNVDSSGKITEAKLTSPGPSQYFARYALQAAQRWQFSPPTVNGQPTASTWVVRFRLRRTSTQVSAERSNR
jgi:TonB family protein